MIKLKEGTDYNIYTTKLKRWVKRLENKNDE